MKVQKHIEVRLLKKRLTASVIDVVQYDTGVQLVFSLVDFDIPSGTSATLYVQKRSGKFVYQGKNITISGNEITINLENQALTEHGETKYQIMLKNGTDTVTTFTGVLRIEKSLADANAVESKTVIRAFNEAVADHVAEFQTKAEQIVAACIATIPDDYTTMEAKVNELANAVKGYLSGAVVFADDVSPVEHCVISRVYGKNLIPNTFYNLLNWETVNGTVNNYVFPILGLKNGVKYTISAKVIDNSFGYFYLEKSKNGFVTDKDVHLHTPNNSFFPYTFEVEKGYEYRLFWYDESHSPFDFATDFQLEEGEIVTEYTAFDPSAVTVRRCGKNLLQNNDISQTTNGISFVVNQDGTVNCSGTATDYVFLTAKVVLNKGKYIFNGCPVGGAESTYSMICYDGNNQYLYDTGSGVEFEVEQAKEYIFYLARFCPNTTAKNLKFLPMVRAFGTNEEFEPYNGTEYIPSSDGTVSGLTSVSPNMTILTDTEGAIVECEYNRDTNKVVEKLTNAIIALGGTV